MEPDGNSNLTNLSHTGSQILFSAPVAGAFKTLTAVNYTGGAGSVIGLNTYLGGDGSPSDKLIINGGAATGNSGLKFTNAGGPGAVTASNGILVVDTWAGGTTTGTAFSMVGRAVQGPASSRLFRGSVDRTNSQAWYLRSQQPAPPPPPPVPSVDPPAPTPAPAGTPAPPTPPTPLYRPEVGAYLRISTCLAACSIHSLHDRLGEPQTVEYRSFEKPDDKRRSVWLRVVGKDIDSHKPKWRFRRRQQAVAHPGRWRHRQLVCVQRQGRRPTRPTASRGQCFVTAARRRGCHRVGNPALASSET